MGWFVARRIGTDLFLGIDDQGAMASGYPVTLTFPRAGVFDNAHDAAVAVIKAEEITKGLSQDMAIKSSNFVIEEVSLIDVDASIKYYARPKNFAVFAGYEWIPEWQEVDEITYDQLDSLFEWETKKIDTIWDREVN